MIDRFISSIPIIVMLSYAYGMASTYSLVTTPDGDLKQYIPQLPSWWFDGVLVLCIAWLMAAGWYVARRITARPCRPGLEK